MPREITHHGEVIEAIRNSGIISELLETHDNHYKFEMDLELVVYGRTYADKRVGPYARLLTYEAGEEIIHEGDWSGNTFYILIDGRLDVYAKDMAGVSRKIGEVEVQNSFGEMAVLAGQPRSATVFSPDGHATVLEIQRPALRLLRKLPRFGERLEANYRRYGLNDTLLRLQEATHFEIDAQSLEKLKAITRFAVYPKDHILFQQGDRIDNLIFINSGWIRRVRGPAAHVRLARELTARPAEAETIAEAGGDIGLDFLGAGNWLGLQSILARDDAWNYSTTVMSRTEALEISVSKLQAAPELLTRLTDFFRAFEQDGQPPEPPRDKKTVAALAEEVGTGIVDGTNVLVMDMDLCIRCGNCSLACHKIHGQSRLVRHGIHIARPTLPQRASIQHVLMPSVCLHCQDPECLTGCPTGAIARLADGHIDIKRDTCIGCADCATQCPYNAITMVPRKPVAKQSLTFLNRLRSWFTLAVPKLPAEVTDTADLLAIKCNLCENTSLNPPSAKTAAYSCQENCPTGALVRVNPREYFSEATNAIGLVFKDRTHAIGRNIHKRDMPARVIHAISIAAVLTIASTIFWAANHYTLDLHLQGTWLTMRWISGLVGLSSIAAAASYSARKQIYTRRVGPLRYWKLAHVYLGILAGIVLLIHGGRDSGGLLTSMLMISFDVVIVAGLFGALCYFVVPRIMTSIEGDPLLIEDLRARRQELRETLALIDTSNEQLRQLVKKKIRRRFFSFSYLLRQYLRREELTTLLAEAREEFQRDAELLTAPRDRRALLEAVETTATLRRVDALIYLHQLLKLWLAPHVVAASIMLALMCVHIVQVTLFTVR